MPPHIVVHCGLNLSGSIGPVVQVVRSKSQDLGCPFFISKKRTGSSLSTVEQQWFRYCPFFVQCVTDLPSTVSIPTQLLFSFSQSYRTPPKLLEHLQQNFCEGNSMQDQPSVAKVITQGSLSFLKVVLGSRHISSSCGESCSYRSALMLQSQQQMKFQVATGSSLSIFTLTVQRGLPPQEGGVAAWQTASSARRRKVQYFIDMIINLFADKTLQGYVIGYGSLGLQHALALPLVDQLALTDALRAALGLELVGVDGTSVVAVEVEVPGLGVAVLDFEEADGELFVDGGVEVVHVESLLGPVGHCLARHGLDPHVGAVLLQPVVVDGSEGLGALAAEVVAGELDVGPAVSGEGHVAHLSALIEAGQRQQAHLVLLRLVLVPLSLDAPVVVVDEVPGGHRLVVQQRHVDRVARVAAPGGGRLRGRSAQQGQEQGEEKPHIYEQSPS